MKDAFREKDGKTSWSRTLGAICIVAVVMVYFGAALAQSWETVRAMTFEVAGLGAALYGINKAAAYFQGKSPPPQGAQNGTQGPVPPT